MPRTVTRPQLTFDIVAASLFAAFAFVATLIPWAASSIGSGVVGERVAWVVAIVVTAAFSVALALRRRTPALALGISWAAAIAQMAAGLPPLPANLAIFAVLYTTAAYGTRRLFWAGFASALVGAAAISLYLIVPSLMHFAGRGDTSSIASYVFALVMTFVASVLALLLAWTIGALVRTGIRARENRHAQQLAEAEAVAEAQRTRVARDMHDVVAHSLAVVIAQADGARYAAASDPQAAATALATISSTARAALADVRMLLTQLRHTQADGPQPTLADLEQLYAHVRAAGVDLTVDVDPAPRGDIAASLQLAVFRILQEALTNALRHGAGVHGAGGHGAGVHGAGGEVAVRLAWHDDRVQLEVTNAVAPTAGQPAADAVRGHGLIGMRERAQLVGGTLESGSDEPGRFVVRAVLPRDGAA
ncbi:MAG: sensor histidine kinase [Microbacterium sp.]|uniref:sensor histidine kinase n=1 Tax=Microbacterium sp. TaxID=51671 RepID=UPI001ACBA555|nr:histidine kinase [Microbacterium sp.]MBN9177693.1 sensor histidine kinase [Microbacterium sp.]